MKSKKTMLWIESHYLQAKSKKDPLIREWAQKAQLITVVRYHLRQKVMRKGLLAGQMLDQNKQLSHQPRNQRNFFNSE